MKNLRILIIAGAVIAAAAIAAIVYFVAFKNPASEVMNNNSNNQEAEGITYTNNEFGYSLILPKIWEGYKTAQAENNILFYIPADGKYKDLGYKYGAILYVAAVPLSEVKNQEQKCKIPDPNRYWAECAAVTESIGGNNAYKFYTRFADDFMPGHEEEGKAVQKSIKFFNVAQAPAKRTFSQVGKDYIFEFQYPTNLFTAEYGNDIFLPYRNDNSTAISEVVLNHTIPVEHCALSGQCTPTTTDLKVGATVLKDTLATIKNSSIGNQLIPQTYGTTKALVLAQGVEGEGIEYYFIEMPNGKVLMMYYQYINENVVQNYKKAKDFIPYAKQTRIAEDIIKSIKFTN
jgi:hypothetical protein